MNVCTICNQEKPEAMFYREPRKSNGLTSQCKQCHDRKSKKWATKNKEKLVADRAARHVRKREEYIKKSRDWYSNPANREKRLSTNLRKMYGISIDSYQSMLSSQNGKCAIKTCNRLASEKTLHVDHDHTTGHVRGLLCHNCNTALGLVGENAQLLQDLIDYINMYDGTSHGGLVASLYSMEDNSD